MSSTILVTIPDCVASHILGSTTIPLTSGELSLIKSSPTLAVPGVTPVDSLTTTTTTEHRTPPETTTPVLTLQMGKLAFPLKSDTVFGTDATSPRTYLFAPELGPPGRGSHGGYVRLEIPASAQEDVEGKGSLQDAFEQALIAEGLLKEGWEAVRDEVERGVRSTVDGIKDKVTSSLSTDRGRVPPEAIEADSHE